MALPLSTQTTDIPQISSLLQLVYLSYKSNNTQPPYQPISIHVFAAHMGGFFYFPGSISYGTIIFQYQVLVV
ncbi:unnamed protein product [Prunus brigantina]